MALPRLPLHRALLAALVAGTLSCNDGPTAPRARVWVTATPEALSLRPLDTVRVAAHLVSLEGAVLTGRPMEWSTLDSAVATVDASGLVTASAYTGPDVRTTSILVTTSLANTDTVPVEVLPWAVQRVIASASSVTLAPNDSAALTATLESEGGLPLTARELLWLSSDTAVVQVNASGRVLAQPYTGSAERSALVTVWSAGIADSVVVTVPPMPPANVVVGPEALTLVPGELAPLVAVVHAASGETLTGIPLSWTSTDTSVARVNADGVVTAVFYVGPDVRTASVIVATGALADTATVLVQPLTAASVTIVPDSGSLLPGSTLQLDATLRDGAGLFLDLSGRPLTWTTTDTSVARVDASGVVTAVPYGGPSARAVTIVVTSGAVADSVTLTVLPHPVAWVTATPEALSLLPLDTTTVAARLESLDLTVLTARSVTWASLDTTVARVSPSGHVTASAYTGPAVRTTSVLVTSGTATDTVPVEVIPFAVARVIAVPEAVTLSPNDSATLAVTLESAGGVLLSAREVVWLSSDTAVATVDTAGRVRARPYSGPEERSALIAVYSNGIADTVLVTVSPLTASSVTVAPDSVSLVPGALTSLAAAVRTALGDTLAGFPLTWSSADTTVARVNVEGVVTASFYVGAATRSTSVIVTSGSLADSATVVVQPLAVASVTIAPDTGTLLSGSTLQLDATLRDAEGLFLSGRLITWSSTDTSVARVDAAGLVTAQVYGGPDARGVQMIAAHGGVADTATLTVPPHAVAWVTATPEALSLQPLDTATVGVQLAALDLTVLTGRSVTWTSLDTTIARVDANGRVTAGAYTGPAVRTTKVIVTSGAASDTVPVEVLPLGIAQVIASPATLTLSPGDTATLSAAVQSENGVVLVERETLWLSSDTAVVQVSATGRVTARPFNGPQERSAHVILFSGGLADSVAVTVTPLIASSVSVSPDTITLLPGAVDSLASLVRTAVGDTLLGFPLTWTSADTTIARVNADGVVTASHYVGPDSRATLVTVATGALADTATVLVQPLTVASVTIAPSTDSLLPSGTLQLDAVLRDGAGLFLTGRPLVWLSLDAATAVVSASGLVTAASYGGPATRAVQIVATSGVESDTVALTIPPHAVAWVTATPEALSLQPLDTATITTALASLDLTALTDRSVTWASLDTTVARVDSAGRVTASAYTGPAVRTTRIVATSAAATDTVPVEVLPFAVASVIATPSNVTLAPGESATLTAAMKSAGGLELSARDVAWLSSDTTIVQVSASGVVTARTYSGPAERSAFIAVYSEGVADTVDVIVEPLAAGSVQVAPDSVTLLPGGLTSLSALVRTAEGDTLTGFPLTWSATDTTVARVNVEGVVTASFYVGADIRAAAVIISTGALADTASVVVEPLAVASVTITPAGDTLLPGATLQLDVVVQDSAALFLTGRPVGWNSTDSALASVNASGLVTAAPYGGPDTNSVLIVAASAGVADTITLTLPPHTVAWVTATPEAISVQPLDTTDLTVELKSLDLTVLSGRSVSWSSLDTTVARVDSTGRVVASAYTGPAVRTTSIVVSSGTAADTVPVEVLPLVVDQVIATPPMATLSPGDSVALTASVESATGIVLTERDLLWLSSDSTVVQVSAIGLATALPYAGASERTATIVVYSEGKADTVAITVPPLAAAVVEVAPDSVNITPGEQAPFTATVRDAEGIVLTGSVMTWTSSDTTVAIVNATGVVTAVFYAGPAERSATVIAAVDAGSVADTVLVRVRPLATDSIALFPATQTLLPEQTVALDAVLRDSSGTFLTGRTVTWTSADTLIASVSDNGVVTAHAEGTVVITATSDSATGHALITVILPVPFIAVLRDTNGTVLAGCDISGIASDETRATAVCS